MASLSRSLRRAAVATRAFVGLGLVMPVALHRDPVGLLALGGLAVVWAVATLLAPMPRKLGWITAEAMAAGAICGAALDVAPELLAALVVAPFVAGLGRGLRGVSAALSAGLIGLIVLVFADGALTESQSLDVFSWAVTGFGLGLVASFVHSVTGLSEDPLAAYREARGLIKDLLELSRDLSSGLDEVSLGGEILAQVRDQLPTAALALHVPHGADLVVLASDGLVTDSDPDIADALTERVVAGEGLLIEGLSFAFPLTTEGEIVAVVAGTLSDDVDPDVIGFRDTVRELPGRLVAITVRLDTALLFAALKAEATAQERGRLAREMHDGVAQDIAYLGYAVDALAVGADNEEQRRQLESLRLRITGVVAEVRKSVLTLRTQVGASESLGAGLGRLARHLGEVSGTPIQVTVDERTTRLRPEVEAELLRIGQEAMNNAVKHARAGQIDVTCRVDPPSVELIVADDGRGLQGGRSDSHGLAIMRERARLIGAQLEILDRPQGGVAVSVRIGSFVPAGRRAASVSGAATATMVDHD